MLRYHDFFKIKHVVAHFGLFQLMQPAVKFLFDQTQFVETVDFAQTGHIVRRIDGDGMMTVKFRPFDSLAVLVQNHDIPGFARLAHFFNQSVGITRIHPPPVQHFPKLGFPGIDKSFDKRFALTVAGKLFAAVVADKIAEVVHLHGFDQIGRQLHFNQPRQHRSFHRTVSGKLAHVAPRFVSVQRFDVLFRSMLLQPGVFQRITVMKGKKVLVYRIDVAVAVVADQHFILRLNRPLGRNRAGIIVVVKIMAQQFAHLPFRLAFGQLPENVHRLVYRFVGKGKIFQIFHRFPAGFAGHAALLLLNFVTL